LPLEDVDIVYKKVKSIATMGFVTGPMA
jgi:hypothetical protein